jgi:hypothetical protein
VVAVTIRPKKKESISGRDFKVQWFYQNQSLSSGDDFAEVDVPLT